MISFVRHGWYKIIQRIAGAWQWMHMHFREHFICRSFFVTLAMKWHLVGILQAQKQKRLPFAAHRSRANLPSLWWKHCVLKQCPKCTRGQKTWATRCKQRTGNKRWVQTWTWLRTVFRIWTHLVQLATEFKRTFGNWKQRDSVNDCCCL